MKFTGLTTSLLVTLAVAAPARLEERQQNGGGGGGCSVGFVFARGSTEPSPLVNLTKNFIFEQFLI
jgi:hypothetical protein